MAVAYGIVSRLTDAAFGHGLATITPEGQTLDVWYPAGQLGLGASAAASEGAPTSAPGAQTHGSRPLGLRIEPTTTVIDSLADPPTTVEDAYLRLHLLSHRIIRPHQANVDGIFGVLPNVAWTSAGPCPVDRVDELRWHVRAQGGHLAVYGVDKFPRMTDYVVPSGVRIADADRVRLGAHLAEGTTVMQEGFVNFNAGTLGASMVEGRIVSGVVVGAHSDIGAGASIMGTLSGGGKEIISIGERCLLGANGGIGISLGDDCVVEAGCYITAGSKLTLPDGRVVKALELSGAKGIRYWRNSTNGRLEATHREGHGITLNSALHAN